MWAIIKYKLNEQNFLKKNFSEVLGESPYYYIPKIRYKKLVNNKIKIFEKSVLEGYLICFHTKFQDFLRKSLFFQKIMKISRFSQKIVIFQKIMKMLRLSQKNHDFSRKS